MFSLNLIQGELDWSDYLGAEYHHVGYGTQHVVYLLDQHANLVPAATVNGEQQAAELTAQCERFIEQQFEADFQHEVYQEYGHD